MPGEIDNGRRVVFCAERGMCVGYTYFKQVCIRTQDGVAIKSTIDLVLVKRDMCRM